MKKTAPELVASLTETLRMLRGPQGCPWDQRQTVQDVKQYLVEEFYELLEAIDAEQTDLIMEEVGDVLFMVMFLVNLYEEKKAFSLRDALARAQQKIIFRHPHVFGTTTVSSAEEVKTNWQALKEKEGKKPRQSLLDGLPQSLPSLSQAFLLTVKAADVGFDWPGPAAVLEKVKEELCELEAALVPPADRPQAAAEIGDLLFSCVNLSRHLGIEPEQALRGANRKFMQRFAHIETELRKQNKTPKTATLQEMDGLWEEAKALER